MTDSNRSTDPVSLPMDVKRKLLAARDALAVGDLMEAHHQIYSIASPHFNKLADEVWTALETPTPDSPGGASDELAAELLADDALIQKAIALYAAENLERGPWVQQGRRVRMHYVRKAKGVSPEPSAEREALHRIKELVCGEARPRWDNSQETTSTRGVIADICDIGLAARRAPEPRDEPLPPCSTCGGETVPFCTSCGYTTTKPAEYPAYTECQHDHMKPNPTLRATYPKHGSQSGWVQEYRCNVCQCSFERPIATAGLRANGETP